ncbi:MAG: MMPL family transporter [Actinomycetota bacterium]|nr:MMPL family transporter [Actinomycetota bacterium]MDD5667037.1 MMPL family transporter [Actinomycetota bacterium]
MSFFARLCRDHARAVVLVCVLLTIPVAVGMTFLEVKAGQKDLIPTKYETARTLEEVDRLFGGTTNEYLMVESDALLTYPMIKKFMLLEGEMVEALGEDDYVYMQHYLSAFGPNMLDQARQRAMEDYGINEEEAQLILADVPTLFKLGEGMMQEDPFNPGVVKPFEQIIEEGVDFFLANPVGYKWTVEKKGAGLFSEDGRYAKILIKVDPALDSSQRKAYATRVEEFFRSYFEGGEAPATVYITGDPSIDKDLEDYVVSSTVIMAFIALAMLMLLLFLTFQRFTDVLLPLAVIVLTAAWIYGLMGWFRLPFTLVSVIIGPLVLGITLGNLVYMMGRFYEEFGMSREPRQAAHKAVLTVGVAIFLACITTFFGFASFGFSDFDVLQEFGYMAAAGIGICFIFSVTFLPAMMIRREERRMRKGTSRTPRGVKIFSVDARSRIDRFLGRIADISQGSPVAVVVVYGFVLLICVMGAFRLTTTPDLRKLAPQDIPSLQAQYKQEEIFGGIQQDLVLLTGDVLEPEVMEAMYAFQEEIAQAPYFGENTTSSIGELISDYRVQFGKAAPGGDFASTLPATRAEAEEDLASSRPIMGSQEGKLISEDHQAALVTVFSEGASSNSEMMEKDRILSEAADTAFGGLDIEYRIAGITPLTADMLGNLVPTQIKTSILALCLSGLFLILVFRSLTYGLATLSVLVAGITVELGFISLMGWTLDMLTVLIVSLIIGMGIDYGIHITHRFLEEHKPGEVSVAEALNICVTRVGKPLVASSICTSGAFLVIAFSKMQPIRRFGLITALSLAVSLLASLLVLPSIITLIARRRQRVEERAAAEAGELKPVEAKNA